LPREGQGYPSPDSAPTAYNHLSAINRVQCHDNSFPFIDLGRTGWFGMEFGRTRLRVPGRPRLIVFGEGGHASVGCGRVNGVASATSRYGRLDAFVNTAATVRDSDRILDHMDVALWDHIMAVNVRGAMLCSKHAIPAMLGHGGGSIIHFTSTAAFLGDVTRIAYSTSKAALIGLTRSIATAYGKSGIRCNAIAPHSVWSDGVKAKLGADWVDLAERTLVTPRAGTPDDVAHMVVYLVSDKAAFVTGQTLRIDGGGTAHQAWVGVR
jgi:NADP-dependent 3-hydroxy acid dehydrogenase YdfG